MNGTNHYSAGQEAGTEFLAEMKGIRTNLTGNPALRNAVLAACWRYMDVVGSESPRPAIEFALGFLDSVQYDGEPT